MSSTATSSSEGNGGALFAFLGLIILLVAAIGIAAFVNHIPNGGLEMLVLLLALLPALIMGFTVSVYQLPYIIAVWAFGPELRRVIDWSYGQYQSITILSLLPLLATLTLLLPILRRRVKVERGLRAGLFLYLGAIAYGAAAGAFTNAASMLVELASYLLPLLVLLYAYQRPFTDANRDMLLRAVSYIAIAVAAYGWFQYLTAPPWDAFWMVNAGMGSIGTPHPLKIRVFSTLNSPGVASLLLGFSTCTMLLQKKWRTFFGWLGVAFVLSALALTLVRSSWIECVFVVVVYTALSSRTKRVQTLLALAAVLGIALVAVPYLPGGDTISSRVNSMGDLQSDNSFRSRQFFLSDMIDEIKNDPIGKGLGSTGTAAKASDTTSSSVVLDNGFAAIYITFGWIAGTALLAAILILNLQLWKTRSVSTSNATRIVLVVAYSVGLMYSLASSNTIPGLGGLFLWLVFCCAAGYKVPPTKAVETELVVEGV